MIHRPEREAEQQQAGAWERQLARWREAEEAELARWRTRPAWYAAGSKDGDAHCGMWRDGKLHALCGLVFTPIRSPLTGVVPVWPRPIPGHGCAACTSALVR